MCIHSSVLNSRTMDFWESLRMLVPIAIPEYLKKLLADTGFDNYLSLEALDESALKGIEDFAAKGKSKLLLGHRIMLLKIQDIIQKTGIEAINKMEASRQTLMRPPPPPPREKRNTNDINLNAEELFLRNKIKEAYSKQSLEKVFHDI